MYNLLVTAVERAWDKPSYVLDFSRYLEHTDDALRERLRALDERAISELTKLPTLFAYETAVDSPARVGWIAELQRRHNELRITPRFDTTIALVSPEKIESRK